MIEFTVKYLVEFVVLFGVYFTMLLIGNCFTSQSEGAFNLTVAYGTVVTLVALLLAEFVGGLV